MAQQKFPKAYEAYQQAVYRDGRNPTFWCSIGVLYYQINQYRDALDAYSRAIRLNPYISEVWYDLGTLVWLSPCSVRSLLLTVQSTSRVTTKQLMRWTHISGLLSLILAILTSRLVFNYFEVVAELLETSTMLQYLKTCILKHIRLVSAFLLASHGACKVLKIKDHNSHLVNHLSMQPVWSSGPEES